MLKNSYDICTSILMGASRLIPGKARDAASFLLRASEKESNVRAALLLEQAGYTFLHAHGAGAAALPLAVGADGGGSGGVGGGAAAGVGPLVRKYAFHLIMAGHLYTKCNQRKHSTRCYQRAMTVYSDRNWYSNHYYHFFNVFFLYT